MSAGNLTNIFNGIKGVITPERYRIHVILPYRKCSLPGRALYNSIQILDSAKEASKGD